MPFTMNLAPIAARLQRQAEAIHALAAGASAEQARWKPDPASWSLLEVINHLDDEERLDFRVRLDLLLHRPQEPWPPIDPQGWVLSRAYNERDLADSLARFREARTDSISWLGALEDPNWESAATSPWGYTIRAGDMLAAWLAHDALHIRQLVELQRAWDERQLAPYRMEYAGEW